ncbi:MAG: NTP transferase domain-containing protein [Candidatus Omnitrophica bacterium]|nr:NTP transferase domain-containing protein [Candidatus Omnitrophota bacterium]
MRSDVPKVLHPIAGRPVIAYVLDIVRSLKTFVVVGHGSQKVRAALGDGLTYVVQDRLLGTADALRRVAPLFRGFRGHVLVLCGDTPLLEKQTVRRLLAEHRRSRADATVLTAHIHDPRGYGRIVRDVSGHIIAIREQKDASPREAQITEINVGAYCFQAQKIFDVLKRVKWNARKKEFYLTDAIEVLWTRGGRVGTVLAEDASSAFGINTRADLARAERVIRTRILRKLMLAGVTIVDPATTYVETGVRIGQDTVIYPCTVVHRDVTIGTNCRIGPFARLRPGTRVGDHVEIGNFTEVSRSRVGKNTFMKHFSFLGDATLGADVNIGAGTVTANFDGRAKNRTTISDGALIGSDAVLVAPVTVGKKAVVGAGSVVTRGKNIPAGAVAFGVPARIIKK